ncbi:MAG: uL15 family ribosomal protein [Nanoarchaeota archaeon]|nr:uL15 family ribosomal protein [Nanoarchaeota archaeon]
MLRQKRKKSQSLRGTNSHGWGHKKKHRGSGSRGGFGLAGTGARGDVKKTSVLTEAKKLKMLIGAQRGVKISKIKLGKDYFGKRGFTSIYKKSDKTMSLNYIETQFKSIEELGAVEKDKEFYVINAKALKVDKILGKAKLSRKLVVIVDEISSSAKACIEEAGGRVEGLVTSDDDFEEE